MNIGEAAARSGLPTKTIRYYESVGLVEPAARGGNGYRDYDERDVNLLRFVQRARAHGFTLQECRELLDLYRDRGRASAEVKAVAGRRIDDIDRRIAELTAMRATLADLMRRCHGDDRPDCPILDDLAGAATEDVHGGGANAHQSHAEDDAHGAHEGARRRWLLPWRPGPSSRVGSRARCRHGTRSGLPHDRRSDEDAAPAHTCGA